jgi:hypothetical protein
MVPRVIGWVLAILVMLSLLLLWPWPALTPGNPTP